ncbi:type IV pilus modification PilV family protein [Caldimonas sp. KR1-144]|uniref:type IV pilus modification PilV family protein n=1 Tax=Caldimonas sp. KR1-144 TaxID=3400911 RepID=UPI003C02D829
MRRPQRLPLKPPPGARGVSLLDALIALLVLSFGMLAMTRFQARVLVHGSEAQNRLTAIRLADELLDLAVMDAGNGACYTLPASGTCATPAARTVTADWAKAVAASGLPLIGSPTASFASNGQLTVAMSWQGRVVAEGAAAEPQRLLRTTDVR